MLRRAKSRPGSRQRHKAMITPDLDGNATPSLILGKIGVHASMPSADGPKPEQAEALRGPKVESPACWARALSFADETSPGNPLWVFRTLSPHPACELACPGPKWLRRRGVIGRGPVSELWCCRVLQGVAGCCRVLQRGSAAQLGDDLPTQLLP